MKFLLSSLVVILFIALVSGQFSPYGFQRFDYNAFADASPTNVRDPRQNRGPVVFPPSPPDQNDESSGVIVGASGYGFVPPQQNSFYYSNLPTPVLSYGSYNFYRNPYNYHYNFI